MAELPAAACRSMRLSLWPHAVPDRATGSVERGVVYSGVIDTVVCRGVIDTFGVVLI